MVFAVHCASVCNMMVMHKGPFLQEMMCSNQLPGHVNSAIIPCITSCLGYLSYIIGVVNRLHCMLLHHMESSVELAWNDGANNG